MKTGKIKFGYGIIQKQVMCLPELSIFSKAVYCLLISYTGKEDTCFPSLKTICENLQVSKNTVLKAIKQLEEFDLLLVNKRQNNKGGQISNEYEPLVLLEQYPVHQGDSPGSPEEQSPVHVVNTKNNIDNNTLFNNKEVSVPLKKEKSIKERTELFIVEFNKERNSKFRYNKSLENTLKVRLKHFSPNEILDSLKNAMKDSFHKETNYKYLTPEFILRVDKLEKYLNANNINSNNSQTKISL